MDCPHSGISTRGAGGGANFDSSVPPSRFTVKFKEGNVTVKVIQGSSGGGTGKVSCKKKGSQCLEVTVS